MHSRLFISLVALFALAVGALPGLAYAQAHPPHHSATPVHPAHAPARPNAVAGVNGAAQDVIRTPRFIVEAVSFHALNESGRDIPYASDEVIAIFNDLTVDHNGEHYWMRTHEFDQVDSGDTRQFAYNESCIVGVAEAPPTHHLHWLCDPHGAQAPLTFRIELFEADSVLRDLPLPGFCVTGFTYGSTSDDVCHGNSLFDHTFTYRLSDLLPRLNNACRCFTETAEWHADSHTAYQVTFRVSRVDEQGPPLTLDANEGPTGPAVLQSGSLTAHSGAAFELDGGAVVNNNGDFDFDRRNLTTFELDAPGSNGASLWVGGATPRGFAACNAQRGSANYVSSAVNVPANGSYACYVTDAGHVGELRIDLLSPLAQTLTITYTTWQ
jgi:hypothetical protein